MHSDDMGGPGHRAQDMVKDLQKEMCRRLGGHDYKTTTVQNMVTSGYHEVHTCRTCGHSKHGQAVTP